MLKFSLNINILTESDKCLSGLCSDYNRLFPSMPQSERCGAPEGLRTYNWKWVGCVLKRRWVRENGEQKSVLMFCSSTRKRTQLSTNITARGLIRPRSPELTLSVSHRGLTWPGPAWNGPVQSSVVLQAPADTCRMLKTVDSCSLTFCSEVHGFMLL